MDNVLIELEKKVERVASAIRRLKEENANLRSENQELNGRLGEVGKSASGNDGAVRELRSKIGQLEKERKSLIEQRKEVEARLEGILSRFDSFEGLGG
ncbi:MAG: cell division protein ZapB [Candidatus Eisenbacteria bacterium]|nr:cell division protein ZapB [Candidatus Eisenbacteria bacterium]